MVERFLAADDIPWDQRLVPYDILGNAVQARVLVRAKVLSKAEGARLVKALADLWKLHEKGKLKLRLSDEDVHTRIEGELTKRLGSLGKKIHTGRSRNDQVLLDLTLYSEEAVRILTLATGELALACLRQARRHEHVPLPGYTHMQRAMPSTIGLWMGSWAQSLFDDLPMIGYTRRINRFDMPLGSASGYGSLVPTDRNYAASLCGYVGDAFKNVLAVQTSRGKTEMAYLHAIAQVLLDCNRLATDCLLFSTSEFGFVKLPASFTTGSSLMPNKRNYDVWELIRAAYHVHLGDLTALASVQGNLPSGYNRDLQVTKGLLIRSFERATEVLHVARLTVDAIVIDRARCLAACEDALLATDRATLLALSGTPFRDAYRAVKSGKTSPQLPLKEAILNKRADGAPGNLMLGKLGKWIRTWTNLERHLGRLRPKPARLLDPSWRMGR